MKTEIDINGSDEQIAHWLWDNHIPGSGQSSSVQGEMLRAIEKLRWEAQTNGNINWDDRFEMFIAFLANHLLAEPLFSKAAKTSIEMDLKRLADFTPVDELDDDEEEDADSMNLPYVEDDLYDRLVSQVAHFCRLHPQAITNEHNPAQYR